MGTDVLVLGAGMVGTCTALQLARRGHRVTLVDRREPGRETSYGNAGIIHREAVEPYPFPRDLARLLQVVRGGGFDVHYHLAALPGLASPLWRYWRASAPARHRTISDAFSRLTAHCLAEHDALMAASGSAALAHREGYLHLYRSQAGLDAAALRAADLAARGGLRYQVLDARALAAADPGLHPGAAGAVHWLDPWSVVDPGALVDAYARHFVGLGGRLCRGDAASLHPVPGGWAVQTGEGPVSAAHAVIALGPWSDMLLRSLGYRLPLFVKRGYHRHFRGGPGLRLPLLDVECGFFLAPMRAGVRLTTGAEFARLGAPPTPVQLDRATAAARTLVDLPDPVEAQPWLGNRPCTADMLPVTGAAPRHPGLWFNFGHAHQGFTLGPVSGRLLAELIGGETPFVDPAPYAPQRFG